VLGLLVMVPTGCVLFELESPKEALIDKEIAKGITTDFITTATPPRLRNLDIPEHSYPLLQSNICPEKAHQTIFSRFRSVLVPRRAKWSRQHKGRVPSDEDDKRSKDPSESHS